MTGGLQLEGLGVVRRNLGIDLCIDLRLLTASLASPPPTTTASMSSFLGAQLQTKAGLVPTDEALAGKEFVMLYFSVRLST